MIFITHLRLDNNMLRMLADLRILLLAVLASQLGYCAYQPLELDSPVTMSMQYGSIYLDYSISRSSSADVLFCFVSTTKTVSGEQEKSDGSFYSTCTLSDTSNTFFCVRLYKDGSLFAQEAFEKTIDINTIWTADKRVKSASTVNVDQSYQPLSSSIAVQLQSEVLTQTIVIKNYFNLKSLYHMLTCPQYNKTSGECTARWKENYVHTFKHPEKKINIIVQRIHNCAVYRKQEKTVTTHVFYGGTLRNSKYYMFTAVLTYLADESQVLSMWGGVAYSTDHANRDMFCYDTDGNAFDAVSIVAGPVYKDIASNIGGTDDAELVDNFYSDRFRRYYMYFIQYHRPYQTDNQLGDERIFKKVYAKFAYAAYFLPVETGQTILNTPSCLSTQNKHNFLMTFDSDVEVFQLALTALLHLLFLTFIWL